MALNIFRQAGNMWRTMTGAPSAVGAADLPKAASPRRADMPGGRDGRDGPRRPLGEISRRVVSGLAASVLCWLCAPGAAFSQPATISLINLNSGQLCVLGNQASYGLTYSSGVWSWSSSVNPVSALPATTGAAIPTNPAQVTTFESARLYLFIIPAGNSYACSNITMPLGSSQIAFGGSPPTIPYAIGEWSLDSSGLHIDQENVDDFQLPLMIEVSGNPGGAKTVFAQIGSAVYSPHTSIQTAVTGYAGQQSPFLTWLTDFNGSSAFTSLARAANAPQAAMILGPTLYLQSAPLTDPLATYFDAELASFFTNSIQAWGALQVMGDAAAGGCTGNNCYAEQAWKVTSTTASCPVYVSGTPNSSSMQLTGTAQATQSFVICNPVGSVVPFKPSTSNDPSWTTGSCPFNPGASTAICYVQITQTDYTSYQNYNGWYFGQPQGLLPCVVNGSTCASGAGITTTAQIYSSCPNGSTLTGACIGFTVGPCSPNCPNPTPGQAWAFSQITPGTTSLPLNVFESSGQMVFGGDGAFGAWMSAYITDQYFSSIAGSVGRNLNEALNRGIAKCNNLTMRSPPAACQNMRPSALIGFTPPSGCTLSAPTAPYCPSDAWWSNEKNWYAAGSAAQNYYSQYLHTGQLKGNSVNTSACSQYSIPSTPGVQNTAVNQCANMLAPPNFYLASPPDGCSTPTGWSPSAQGVPMGTAYGFAYDENPVYLASQPAQVPSKFDPLPSCWGSITSFSMVIGRAEPLAAHDLNGDSKSDIVWRDTSGDVAFWLMNGAAVSSTGGVGGVSTAWSIVGQRDFNGDGMADLLWRDTSGDNAIWFMNGTQVASSAGLGNVPSNWTVIGTGDFNGDGIGDILWEDSNGNLAVWLMNSNATVLSSGGLGAVPPSVWAVAGIGDFNGDGRADILWRDTSGDTSIWFMNGTAVASSAGVGNVPITWSVTGTGDFNGDGIADIAWRDSSGNMGIWLMNGASVLTTGGLGNLPISWSMVQTGDYNGDGMSDLLWRDTSGNTAMWFMNGTTVASSGTVGNIPIAWTVQSVNAD
jgi:FG-GAP-like repeat